MKYKRVMLKISGEVLSGDNPHGADGGAILKLCAEIKDVHRSGVQIAIVIGGGNFWRYRDNKALKISRVESDTIGMMATIMNARLLKNGLEAFKVKAKVLAPHVDFCFAEPYVASRGIQLLERKEIVICGGGTGNPFFTTDSAAALRALELGCDVVMKATKVDGVYDSDPVKNKNAKFFEKITYDEVLKRKLEIMDLNAVVLARENHLPVHVFNMKKAGNLLKAVKGKTIGTLIY